MIGRLNHVAIAVPDLEAAAQVYRGMLGAAVSEAVPQPKHGVTVIFVTLPNTKIELLEPLGDSSPIAAFLERNPSGGIHHLCYEVDDILPRPSRRPPFRQPPPGEARCRHDRPHAEERAKANVSKHEVDHDSKSTPAE